MNTTDIDIDLLRDQLLAFRSAIERTAAEAQQAEERAKQAFESGDPQATHEAMLAAQQAKDRLAGLQQQAQATEAQLRQAIQPEIDRWAEACAEDAGNWASRTAFLTAELADALAKLEHVLDVLGGLPAERTAILEHWQAHWQTVVGQAPEISIERPAAPSLTMPDVGPAMDKLGKLAETYAKAGPGRPNLAGFLAMR